MYTNTPMGVSRHCYHHHHHRPFERSSSKKSLGGDSFCGTIGFLVTTSRRCRAAASAAAGLWLLYSCCVAGAATASTSSGNQALGMAAAFASSSSSRRSAVLVTGSTDGIGVTTAKNLAAKGYDVLVHGRDEARIQKAKETIESFGGTKNQSTVPTTTTTLPRIRTLPAADLSTVAGSRQLASSVKQICQEEDFDLRVIMNNAGVYSEKHVITSDGTELTFAVNVVAPFVLTSLLLPTLLQKDKQGGDGGGQRRIVIASSISQCGNVRDWNDLAYNRRPYSAHGAYSESKLLDAMLTFEFAARFQRNGIGTDTVTCNCLDPGTVNTKMLLAGWGPCGIDVESALDQTWLCSSDEVQGVTGKYFTYQNERPAARSAYNPAERKQMWSILSALAPQEAKMWDFDWHNSSS